MILDRLTDEQQSLVKDCYHWFYNSDDLVFEYAGGPGTGKSYVLDFIIEYLKIDRACIAPMAFTGAAAVNMRTKGLLNAGTIHSWIYNTSITQKKDKDGIYVVDEYFNRPKETINFVPKVKLNHIKLIIIDEAYMVPIEMKNDIEKFGIKILACGDWNQLPPVNSMPAYLNDPEKVKLLTKTMRQSEWSSIVKLAYNVLNGFPISNGYYGDVLVINEDELTDQMIMSSDVVICSKNATREFYNNKIRKIYGFNGKTPQYGERVICRSNNKDEIVDGINLANGLIGTVVNYPDVSGFDGKTFKMLFKPDLLDNAFDIKISYKYFTAPYQQKDILKNDRYLEGEKFEFGYAITAHLSQGSQFNNVIVIDEPMFGNINNRLAYVAITRAKRRLIYVKRNKIKK
jgi:exodeoxyribonuclease-5